MNKQVIFIIVGLVILLLAGYFAWRYLVPQIIGGGRGEVSETAEAAREDIEAVLGLELSELNAAIIGETIFIDRNSVVSAPSENVLWLAPVDGDKGILVIENSEDTFIPGDIVRVKGEVKRLSEFSEIVVDWTLTNNDVALMRANPIVLVVDSIEIVD